MRSDHATSTDTVSHALRSHAIREAQSTSANKSSEDSLNLQSANNSSQFASTLAAMLVPQVGAQPQLPEPKPTGLDSDLDQTSENASTDETSAASVTKENTGTTSGKAKTIGAAATDVPVTSVNNDPDALNTGFRTRLDRVINRMHDEYGYSVNMVEGYRPQARQNFLYEQGRDRPGQVVTWTKSSKHTAGIAADLMIDGSYDDPVAYQRLAQIANQEGLRTLGTRDPGHVELPTRNGAAAWGSTNNSLPNDTHLSRTMQLALSQGGAQDPNATVSDTHSADTFNAFISRGNNAANSGTARSVVPATVAQVAPVANVATISSVAIPAIPGGMSMGMGMNTSQHGTSQNPDTLWQTSTGSDAAARIGNMLDVRDASPARPLSFLNLAVENDAGGTDHVRVNVRGTSVDTHITLDDADSADRMSLRVGELERALEHHGLDADAVHVAVASSDVAAPSQAATSDTGSGWTPRQQSSHNRDSFRQDADSPKHRSRRAKEDTPQ